MNADLIFNYFGVYIINNLTPQSFLALTERVHQISVNWKPEFWLKIKNFGDFDRAKWAGIFGLEIFELKKRAGKSEGM
jgi:hypothetical protein